MTSFLSTSIKDKLDEGHISLMKNIILDGLKTGEIRPAINPEIAAIIFFSMIQGLRKETKTLDWPGKILNKKFTSR